MKWIHIAAVAVMLAVALVVAAFPEKSPPQIRTIEPESAEGEVGEVD